MERFKAANKASILGILGNIILFTIKALVGFTSHSQAMIADALNSASDIFSSLMTFIGNKIAATPADNDHNLGHGKAEYIYSFLISITMIIVGIKTLIDSIKSIYSENTYNFSIWLLVVCIITITIKFLLYLYTSKIGKKYNNLLVTANSKDHRNDCIITTFNLISVISSIYNIYIFDSIVGIGISIWITYTGLIIFKDSYDVLMDKAISDDLKLKVIDLVTSHKEVIKINHFNATPVGYLYQISFTIFVDGNLNTFDSHAIADHLEKEIKEKFPEIYLSIIHVNPTKIDK